MYNKFFLNITHSLGGFNFATSQFLTSPPLVNGHSMSSLVNGEPFKSTWNFPPPLNLSNNKQSRKSGSESPSPSLHSAINCSATGDKLPALFGAQPVPVIPRVLQGEGRTATGVTWPSSGPACLQRVDISWTVKTKVKQSWKHQVMAGNSKVTKRAN